MSESGGHKKEQGRSGFLRIDATDMRPKCQPIGAQIDCRWERCDHNGQFYIIGWCDGDF